MRLHVISLPHTQTTKAYSTCAYTEKVRKFCNMMKPLGHEIILYAGEENEADCTELVTCITKEQQKQFGFNGPTDYLAIDFNASEPWGTFNANVIRELSSRVQPKQDVICVITGSPTLPIAEAYPENLVVEFGVGYSGIAHKYRVFESYAWRNYVYGYHHMDGAFFDEVIPNYFEVDDFPLQISDADYFLFIGRLNANKGLSVAQEVCERLGKTLVVAGPGEFSGYGEYQGVVGPEQRAHLMGFAKAVFVPTMYVPPFEGVHIEAMLCGTPVITTDFGVFSETIENGLNGYRCRNLQEFMDAAEAVGQLNQHDIRARAVAQYSTHAIAPRYEQYFNRLLTLYGDGWYNVRHKQNV